MGYFDFVMPNLLPDDDIENLRKEQADLKKYNATPRLYTEADLGEDAFKYPSSAEQNAMVEPKPYSQRRAESTAKVFETADRIISKYATALPRQLGDEAEKTRNEVRANPDNAAKSLEKFFEKVKPYIASDEATHSAGVQDPWDHKYTPMGPLKDKWAPSINFYDKDFLDLENHVRGIRTMKRGPEETALTGELTKADLAKNIKERDSLQSQLDALTKDIASNQLPEAVSRRSELENQKIVGGKQQAALALSEHIDELNKQIAKQQGTQQPVTATSNGGETNVPGTWPADPKYFDRNGTPIAFEQWQKQHEDLKGSIDGNIKGSGRDPKQFRQAMIAGAQKLEQTMGVDTANLKDPVPFSRALLTGLQIFDPQGIILQQLSQDLQPNASAGGGQQTTSAGSGQGLSATKTTPEEDLHTKNLAAMRDQRRSLYQQLGQTPELNNWFGVLTFIFLSVITRSPSVAASILGISQRQGSLKLQLDNIEKDMHDEAFQLKQAQHEGDIARKMAADRALHQSDKADEYKRELMKMYLNHHAILLREAQRHPEGGEAYKRLDKDFARYSSMESSAHSEMMRADKDRNDPFADDAHKAQAEKDYQNSRKVWLFWSNKRKELNQTLEEMHVGGAGASGIEETPQ